MKYLGEPASPVYTANGVNSMSCIDPKNKNTKLDGFQLPASLGDGVGDGQCMGAEVGTIPYLAYSLNFWKPLIFFHPK